MTNSKLATKKEDSDAVVFVIDDDISVRESLSNLLRSVQLRVETFSSAQEFLAAQHPPVPGCLILDIRLPGLSGLDLQRQLISAGIALPIIFITGHGDIPMSVRAMKAGAVDFLSKPFRDQDLLDAVQQAIQRNRNQWQEKAKTAQLLERYASLSPREQEVMALVVKGLINKQIGERLNISEPTVKLHRGSLMHKMGAESLAELVRMGERLGAEISKGPS